MRTIPTGRLPKFRTEVRGSEEWVFQIHRDGTETLFTKRTVPPAGARGYSRDAQEKIARRQAALRRRTR